MTQPPLITPVVLSGGSGTRLWPLSTPDRPKQFLDLLGPISMFQLTLQRCVDQRIYRKPVIVGSARHIDVMQTQMQEVSANATTIILEPCARNTAPAITLAALAAENPSDLLLVMPSDHIIKNVAEFQEAVLASIPVAQSGSLVTFGIEPTGPATGYGYIQQGDATIDGTRSLPVKSFVEKPNRANAEKMLADGGYYWNAGIFLFRADSYQAALNKYSPEILSACRSAMDRKRTENGLWYPDPEAFASAPSDSIDYAIMEKAETVSVTPVNPGWSDVGSWDALFDICDRDEHSNVILGKAAAIDSSNNLVHSPDLEVAILGVENLVIVTHGNKVLVLPRGRSQEVQNIMQKFGRD